jgi:hypothetical protein
LPCPDNLSTNEKRDTAMKKIATIVGLALATGMVLTTAFAFSLLPLLLI